MREATPPPLLTPAFLLSTFNGVIAPVTVEIVTRALQQAASDQDAAVVLRIDTPGGLMDSMRQISQQIIASPVPVVTWVAPSGARGASAGFFILEAGDVAAMAPGTNTGAAHPVLVGTEMDPIMKEKVENDAAASLRSVTSRRGRNSELAEKAIRESKSFTEKEALDNKLIEIIAANENDLAAQLDGRAITRFNGSVTTLHVRDAQMQVYEPNLRQQILSRITDPNMALILLVIGALLLYVEFSHPGTVVPGAFGAVLVLLGLSALSVLPINWLGCFLAADSFDGDVCTRSQVCDARHSDGRRRGLHGVGRGDAGGQPAAGAAGSPLHGDFSLALPFAVINGISAVPGGPREGEQGHHRSSRE